MKNDLEALVAAMKITGQDTTDIDKMTRLVRAVQTIQREGATPDAMLGLLAQNNPKFAAMAALVKALGANSGEQAGNPPKGDDIQYNHF